MGEIQPNKCEGRELTKDQLAAAHELRIAIVRVDPARPNHPRVREDAEPGMA